MNKAAARGSTAGASSFNGFPVDLKSKLDEKSISRLYDALEQKKDVIGRCDCCGAEVLCVYSIGTGRHMTIWHGDDQTCSLGSYTHVRDYIRVALPEDGALDWKEIKVGTRLVGVRAVTELAQYIVQLMDDKEKVEVLFILPGQETKLISESTCAPDGCKKALGHYLELLKNRKQ